MSGLAPSLPLSLGRYTLLERVGGGGMATVYRATLAAEEGFQKEVAVKVVRDELASDGQFTALFLDEARLAARLSHANVVQTFDFGQVDGIYYLAMEFVPGHTLSGLTKVLRTRGLSLGVVRSVHIAAEVAKGLGYAHRLSGPDGRPLGLVHRDVSPQNVLVSNEGEVKLADFGIAKAAMRSHVTQPGRVRGKCAYMAPEQARGLEVDARADVFALGIVLWECLTGVALFDGPSDAAILLQVVEKEIPPPSRFVPDMPPVLDEAVMRLLARDRNARPESCAPVARLLADINHGLVRSHADIDLAELQRSLTSGTAVMPLSLLPSGGASAGAALPPSGGTPVPASPEPVAAQAFDPRAETVTPGSMEAGTRVDARLPDGARPREPVEAATVVEGARAVGSLEARAVEAEEGGAPLSDPRTRTAERRRAPGGRRLAIGAGSVVGAALALVVLVRWVGSSAAPELEQGRGAAAGLEIGGAGRELPAPPAETPGTGTPGTGLEARRVAAAPAAGAAPPSSGARPPTAGTGTAGTRTAGTGTAGTGTAGTGTAGTGTAGTGTPAAGLEVRRIAAAPATPSSPGSAARAAAPATGAQPREGGKAAAKGGELVVSSRRAAITVVLDHDAGRSQRLTAQQPIRLPTTSGQHFLTFVGIGMKTCVVAVELPAGGRLAVQLDAQGKPELLDGAKRRPLSCVVR